jgi:hypothetical protein
MKRSTLLLMALCVSVASVAQMKPYFPGHSKGAKAPRTEAVKHDILIGSQPVNHTTSTKGGPGDSVTMITRYDLQTNSSNQNRMYYYSDGSIVATASMSHTDGFADRGTGYNIYNGTDWGEKPQVRIESSKAGWPSYAPLGENGEIIVSHHNTAGLFVERRTQRGTGAWTETILAGPAGAVDISWPRVVTNGPDRNWVHIICVTYVEYMGLDNALLYYRSLDGGQSWDIQHMIIDGLSAAEYLKFSADTYTWAEPMGDTLCFVVGDSWTDQFIMKSTDNGITWTKTIIWPCAFNLWEGGDTTGTFYCPDGASAIALDNQGKAHVTFGLQRASGDEGGNKFWVPYTDGLIYWNESMPELPQDLDPETLMAEGNYIGWVQDTMVFYATEEELAHYSVSLSSFPTMVIDEDNAIFVVWSSVTEHLDFNQYLLRHLYGRASFDGGLHFEDTIVPLTDKFIHNFMECVYPTASPTSSYDKIFLVFQGDPEAGVYLNGAQGVQGQSSADDNEITFLEPTKFGFLAVGQNELPAKPSFVVSQNMPNPSHGLTYINVSPETPGELLVELYSTVGRKVLEKNIGMITAGTTRIAIDASQLTSGIYFYKVTLNGESVTKKMIVN